MNVTVGLVDEILRRQLHNANCSMCTKNLKALFVTKIVR